MNKKKRNLYGNFKPLKLPWFLPFSPWSFQKTIVGYFFIFIFNFKISFLLFKDYISLFLPNLLWQISSTLFCFCFVFLLSYLFLSLTFLLFFDCLFPAFLFPVIFWTILIRNIFYQVAFLIRHVGVISKAHIILLQGRSQEFLRAG